MSHRLHRLAPNLFDIDFIKINKKEIYTICGYKDKGNRVLPVAMATGRALFYWGSGIADFGLYMKIRERFDLFVQSTIRNLKSEIKKVLGWLRIVLCASAIKLIHPKNLINITITEMMKITNRVHR